MTTSGFIWKGALALIGCMLAAYVGDEVLGGGALGWTIGGAILGGTCAPLFKTLLAINAARQQRRQSGLEQD
ncbi:hypothetical protein [Terrihabitans sp. B22-R8]|uniref:hypothetical protein n=1 Tax=Terrihabitans sp. B22-R8 TaxID=3425128 RepID=UPI00403CD100